jgi:hypothetical protein
MDEASPLVIEMHERIWPRLKADLHGVTPEEAHWRPLPRVNTLATILKHLRVDAQWFLANLDHGEHSPYQDAASVQQLTEAVPLDSERNLQELEGLYLRFLTALRQTAGARLRQQTVLAQVFPVKRRTPRTS